ncbi:MAG: cytochrome c [Polyangiaceae bacterium]|nr:cytochrome c [Polyangiaceae bacterium]MCE7891083.1 cytochrome c [Sorangiineae bacterium PRO1]MCL4750595.1 c-type cytochrome [Myxococcales bacterium]
MSRRSALLVSLALVACASRSGSGPSDAQLSAARKAAPAGAKVFALYCSSCHGEHGDAPFAPAAMGKQALRRRPGLENGLDLFRYVKARMPPGDKAGSLSEEQYWAVTEYMLRVQERPLQEPFDATTAPSVRLE